MAERTNTLMDQKVVGVSGYLSVYLNLSSIDLSAYLSIFLSIYLSESVVYLSFYLSIYPSIYLSVGLPVYPSICLSIYLSVCLSVCRSVCLSVSLSLCLSVSLSICLSICLSVYLTQGFMWQHPSRHSGVHFFDISTCKSGPNGAFPQQRAPPNVLRATTAYTFFTTSAPKSAPGMVCC